MIDMITKDFITFNANIINRLNFLENQKDKIKDIASISIELFDSNDKLIEIDSIFEKEKFDLKDKDYSFLVRLIKCNLLSQFQMEIDSYKKILADNNINVE